MTCRVQNAKLIIFRNDLREKRQVEQQLDQLKNEKRVLEERNKKLSAELNKVIAEKAELVDKWTRDDLKIQKLECEN